MPRPAPSTPDRPGGPNRANRLPVWFVATVTVPPAAFLLLFYAWPFATLLGRGLGAGSAADALASARTWRVVWFTCWQAVVSTAVTLLIGMAPAWATSRFSFPGRRLLTATLTAVFVLPTVVVGAAFVALLPDSLDRSVLAIVGAHTVFNLAVVVRVVGAAWAPLPPDLEHAAATLGASPWQRFRLVTLPLLAPAIAAAAGIVFLFTFTSFGVVRVLGGVGRATIEVEVWRRATQLGDIGGAATLSVLQLVVLAAAVLAAQRFQRSRPGVELVRGALPSPVGRQRWVVGGVAAGTALFVLVPLGALVERSFRFGDGYSLQAWRTLDGAELRPGLAVGVDPLGALGRSLTTAVWATVFAVLIGALAIVAIDALGRSGRLLDTGLMLPLGTSAVTIGFGMLITFDTPPVDWRAEWWLVPVGHALVAAPFVVRSGLGVLRNLDADLRSAAATLGASPLRAWTATTLPFLRRPLASGAGIAAAISLGEFGATSFLSRSGGETLPIAIEQLLGRTGRLFQAQAFALATILAALTIVVVLVVDRVAGDTVGAADTVREPPGGR
jgi:thiamine transport system permease protein